MKRDTLTVIFIDGPASGRERNIKPDSGGKFPQFIQVPISTDSDIVNVRYEIIEIIADTAYAGYNPEK